MRCGRECENKEAIIQLCSNDDDKGLILQQVLVCGPIDSGKTTLVRTLLNYALKADRQPMLVDLDPSEDAEIIPGALTAIQYTGDEKAIPYTHWYGHTRLKENPEVYKVACQKIAQAVNRKLEGSAEGDFDLSCHRRIITEITKRKHLE